MATMFEGRMYSAMFETAKYGDWKQIARVRIVVPEGASPKNAATEVALRYRRLLDDSSIRVREVRKLNQPPVTVVATDLLPTASDIDRTLGGRVVTL